MGGPVVSVIVPAYRQAAFLGETIRSVLAQTYPNFELLVVDDASPDDTAAVVAQFTDPRLRYIVHERNLGLPATRNTGIEAASGEVVAFLDADDLFHPRKLESHVAHLEAHGDVGVTYNARFELNHSAETIREIWRPPPAVSLVDLVLGFPFAPSDMVVRREWLRRVGPFDPAMGSAEDTDLPCRLALSGCRFAAVDRVLNSRRYHSGRGRKNLMGRRNDVARAIDAVFSDPRCPDDVRALGSGALTHHLMVLVSLALLQDEKALASEFYDELVRTSPAVVERRPCELVSFLMMESVADDGLDHEEVLRQMFDGLPQSARSIGDQYGWAVARGYLWKGVRAALWGRSAEGEACLDQARARQAGVDEEFTRFLTSHLLNYAHECGEEAGQEALDRVASAVGRAAGRSAARRVTASYHLNRAIAHFQAGDRAEVPALVLRAIAADRRYLRNRGVVAMLARSIAPRRRAT